MAQHNELGKEGENYAALHLQTQGYEIIARNWLFEKYEIDIIACNADWIVFAEVKTRSSSQWGHPEEAISKGKIKRLVEAANFYLQEYNIDLPARFDVLAIVNEGNKYEVEHFEDAFLAPTN